jgi:hypothetical protein
MPDEQSPASETDIVSRLMELEQDAPDEDEPQDDEPAPQDDEDTEPVAEEADDEPEAEEEAEEEPEAEEFELHYNGTTEKVPKDRAKALAQQGLYYERNQAQVDQHWKQAQEVQQFVTQQLQTVPELQEAAALVSMYQKAVESIDIADMQKLATEDPAQYLAKLAEYNTLNRRLTEAQAKHQAAAQQFAQSQQQFQSEALKREREALFKAVPDWQDAEKFQKAKARILAYAQERLDPEIVSLMERNHKALLMGYDAARFRESQKALKASAKSLGTKPKVAKPGASTSPAQANDEQTKVLRQQLKKTGKIDDAARLFERFV